MFAWDDYKSWRRIVLDLLSDLIDASVFSEMKAHPPEWIVGDNLDWLDEAIAAAKGGIPSPNVWSTLNERFPSRFRFVRAFHGCRTESIEPYREQGILPSDPSTLDHIAYQIFSKREAVAAAIEDLTDKDPHGSYGDHNRGKVFFCLQMAYLVEECGHYLLYGSEYLLCIANRIGEPRKLRERGKATVIECNVPVGDIPGEYLRCLTGEIMREIFEKYCHRNERPRTLNFGFPIRVPLNPSNIVTFHFPTRIPNPHNGNLRED